LSRDRTFNGTRFPLFGAFGSAVKKKTTDGVGTFDGNRKIAPKRFSTLPVKIAGGNNVLKFVAAFASFSSLGEV
jgi:hypothetical protein